MTESTKSPDKLELKGKPAIGVRFGKKAGVLIGGVLFTVLALVIYGIATRDGVGVAGHAKEEEKKNLMAAGQDAAGKIYAGVGDGMAVPKRTAPDLAGIGDPSTSNPLEVPHGEQPPITGQPSSANLNAQQLPATGPDEAAMRAKQIKDQREAEYHKALMLDSAVSNWKASDNGESSGAMASNQNPPGLNVVAALNQLQNMTKQNSEADDPNKQPRKESFLAMQGSERNDYLEMPVKPPRGIYELKTTSVIPATLITGINSDLPGEISAQVTDHIYDTVSGKYLLIPKGTRIHGLYDSRVAYGQRRVLVAWSRLQFPNGDTLQLEGMTGGDRGGYAGFHDQVDNHYGRIIGFGLLSAAFSTAFQLSQPKDKNSDTLSAREIAAAETGRELSQLGIEMTKRQMNIQPTLVIRPGYQFVVKVNKDISFQKAYN